MTTTRSSLEEYLHKPVEIGPVASNIDITYGTELATGRTIIVKGDIGTGTKVTLYGWNLCVRTIQEGAVIEYAKNFNEKTQLHVSGDIKSGVVIKNAHDITVEGKIHDNVRISASGKIIYGDIGEGVVINGCPSRAVNRTCCFFTSREIKIKPSEKLWTQQNTVG